MQKFWAENKVHDGRCASGVWAFLFAVFNEKFFLFYRKVHLTQKCNWNNGLYHWSCSCSYTWEQSEVRYSWTNENRRLFSPKWPKHVSSSFSNEKSEWRHWFRPQCLLWAWIQSEISSCPEGFNISVHNTLCHANNSTRLHYQHNVEAVYWIKGQGEYALQTGAQKHEFNPEKHRGTLFLLENDAHVVKIGSADSIAICLFFPALKGNERLKFDQESGSSY